MGSGERIMGDLQIKLIQHLHDLTLPPVLDVLGKWVSCPNAKTGTTSIHVGVFNDRSIVHNRGRENWERVWNKVIVPNMDELVMFTFVRNPWDRVLSAFLHCRDKARNPKSKIARSWKFLEYVKEVLAVKGTSVNAHFAPQYDTIQFQGRPIPGMFVGRFERLEHDWAHLAKRLDVDPALPRQNVSGHKHYTTYYDNESVEIIGRIYSQEIGALNYEFA